MSFGVSFTVTVSGVSGVVVVEIVELARVFEVDLQCARPDPFGVLHEGVDLVLRQPHKVSDREGLAHRPAVKIVGVQVLDEGGLLLRIVISNVFVVGLRVPVRYHGNSSANAFLEEQVHVAFRKEFQFDVRHLQHGVPGQGRRGDVVGGIQPVFPKADVDKIFEDVCQ